MPQHLGYKVKTYETLQWHRIWHIFTLSALLTHAQLQWGCRRWLCLKFLFSSIYDLSDVINSVCSTCSPQHVCKLCFVCRRTNSVCSTCSPQHVCKPCFVCHWTNNLEFTARWIARSSSWLQTFLVRLLQITEHQCCINVSGCLCYDAIQIDISYWDKYGLFKLMPNVY